MPKRNTSITDFLLCMMCVCVHSGVCELGGHVPAIAHVWKSEKDLSCQLYFGPSPLFFHCANQLEIPLSLPPIHGPGGRYCRLFHFLLHEFYGFEFRTYMAKHFYPRIHLHRKAPLLLLFPSYRQQCM